jgi:hypothetical protein
VKVSGGLKLALTAAARDDRRLRCTGLTVASVDGGDERTLVTDSCGRLRYHLAPGPYRLEVAHFGETEFAVHDGRWTSIRLRLP